MEMHIILRGSSGYKFVEISQYLTEKGRYILKEFQYLEVGQSLYFLRNVAGFGSVHYFLQGFKRKDK